LATDLTEELGVYVGPVAIEDAIRALEGHTPGEWVMQLVSPENETLWHKTGWSWTLVESDDYAVFTVAFSEQAAGNPSLYVDAPLVLTFAKGIGGMGEIKQYVGGLVFKFGFGDYAGHTLTLLPFHAILHVTETGDIAPGFGEVEVKFHESEDE
jgi:hypothetical protein